MLMSVGARKKSGKLDTYREKRSPDRTPEPFGGASAPSQRFVVQLHAARARHYDFRLEWGGVLLSWAVPKGPSPNPQDKRLAVQTEDHPVDYVNFEGVIPDGNYGAGAVIVWDRGRWVPLKDPDEGFETGKFLFELKGYKLRGRWTLVKTKRAEKEWLLIKERDAYVEETGTEGYPQDSILSGLTVEQLADGLSPDLALEERLSEFGIAAGPVDTKKTKPMLAKPGKAFTSADWLFELKYDGYRLLIHKQGGDVTLRSRNGHDLTAVFPEIANVVSALPHKTLLLDGEVVVHDEQGFPSFARLQKRGRLSNPHAIERASVELPATLYLFDLLAVDDVDVRKLPLETRKEMLRQVLPTVGPLKYSDHVLQQGEAMFEQVQNMGLEGIVAKRLGSSYVGRRSDDWVKVNAHRSDDFAVIGYTPPKGSQPGVGSLLLGQYEGSKLCYVGRVGSGLSHEQLNELADYFEQAPEGKPPDKGPKETGVLWTAPERVVQVRFKNRTRDGLLRQPVFMRFRDDKKPSECLIIEATRDPPKPKVESDNSRQVRLTNLDKVFWPDDQYTKGDLVDYYRSIAPAMLPYLKDRPLVLTRFPDGIEGKSFFQKDAPAYAPDWLRLETMWSEHAEREIRYFIVEDEEALVYVANMGAIPLHIWSSRVSRLQYPDWCILDLDPKGAPFTDVVKIALAFRKLCDEIGLPSFIKTSGSTGLHILVPLGAQYTYEQSRTLGELLARWAVKELPDIATITRRTDAREGKVYVDYLQNGHGRLLVAPLCVRPLPGAPVSMPMSWKQVNRSLDMGRFTIKTVPSLLKKRAKDPMLPVLDTAPDLMTALNRLAAQLA